jgi:hypothetical protein
LLAHRSDFGRKDFSHGVTSEKEFHRRHATPA